LIEKESVEKFRFGQGKELSKKAFSTISLFTFIAEGL
jgi:hypothetical protein